MATWVKLEGITLSKLSRERQMPYDVNYKEFQKKKKRKTKDGTQSRKMIAKDWRVGQIGRDF